MALDTTHLHSRLIRHSPVPQVHSIIRFSEIQAFPEAASLENCLFDAFCSRGEPRGNVLKTCNTILSPWALQAGRLERDLFH